MKLIASNQMTLTNLKEKAIERTGISFWHGLSAVKHPLGIYDCGSRDHAFGNEFDVVSGKNIQLGLLLKEQKELLISKAVSGTQKGHLVINLMV